MSEKRWASNSLVNMLIGELKDYKSAGEVVSGAEDVFAMCSRDIASKVEQAEEDRSAAAAFELQTSLQNAKEEVESFESWRKEVTNKLSKQDDESGLTGPLRQAFAKSGEACARLKEQVEQTEHKYFSK